jgi:hypothetical protein
MELMELRGCLTGIEKECMVKAEEPTTLVMETSKALAYLGFPYPGSTSGPEESSGSPKGDERHPGAPTRGICLRC